MVSFYKTHQQLAASTTSLQENQHALQASEDHLTLAVEAAQLGTWDWNLETETIIWSAQCEELFGLEPGSFAGTYEAFAQLVHPDDVEPLGQALQATIAGSGNWKRDFRIVHADDRIRWMTSTEKFIYEENKKAVRAIGVVEDNTDHRQAEALLQQANILLEQQVAERTTELRQANDRLQRELFARELAEIALKQEADRQAALIATQFEIATAGLDLSQVMNLIVERSQQLTQADGAAIELAEGDEMVYRAASGLATPYIGLRLKISSSLSGRCWQTGEILRCDDTEVDPRVDQAACKRIGVRSMIVVPLQYDQKTLGILKVLGAQVQAFDDQDTNTLLLMAGTLADAIQYALEFAAKQALIAERTIAFEQIQLLQTLTLAIAADQDINTALELVLKHVGRFQGWDYGEVWLPEPKENILECQTTWCKRPEGKTFAQLSQLKTYKFPISSPTEECLIGGVAINITDRKRAEAILQESEERYRSVVAAIAEGIVLQQADGTITACNASAKSILGLTADQMMGRTSVDPRWQAIHEDGSPFPGEDHPTMVAIRTGQPCFNTVMGVHKPDGRLNWILVNAQPLFHPGELLPYAVVASFLDITDRKQTEERLKLQSIILKNMTGGVCLVRIADWVIAYTNPKFESMFGYAPGELNGQQVNILNYQDDRVNAAEVTRAIMTGIQTQGEATYEVHNVKKDGTPFWCQATASMFEHPKHGTVVVAVQHDITDRKRTEDERQRVEQALQDREALLRSVGDNCTQWSDLSIYC